MKIPVSASPLPAKRPAPSLPAIARSARRRAVLADLLAGDDAWAEQVAVGDLAREAGLGFLASRSRSAEWEG